MTRWAVESNLGPNLVEHVNNEFSTNDDPYRSVKIKYIYSTIFKSIFLMDNLLFRFKQVEGISMKLFRDIDHLKVKEGLLPLL